MKFKIWKFIFLKSILPLKYYRMNMHLIQGRARILLLLTVTKICDSCFTEIFYNCNDDGISSLFLLWHGLYGKYVCLTFGSVRNCRICIFDKKKKTSLIKHNLRRRDVKIDFCYNHVTNSSAFFLTLMS